MRPSTALLSASRAAATAPFFHRLAPSRLMWCAGGKDLGQRGHGATGRRDSAARVVGVDDAAAVSSSDGSTCARRRSGRVACWGFKMSGELGDGTTVTRGLAADVVGLDDAVQTAAGYHHHRAPRVTGAVVCLGENIGGALGDGSTATRATPVMVVGL